MKSNCHYIALLSKHDLEDWESLHISHSAKIGQQTEGLVLILINSKRGHSWPGFQCFWDLCNFCSVFGIIVTLEIFSDKLFDTDSQLFALYLGVQTCIHSTSKNVISPTAFTLKQTSITQSQVQVSWSVLCGHCPDHVHTKQIGSYLIQTNLS